MSAPSQGLCVSIVRNAAQIRDRLQAEGAWDRFRGRIARWRDEWLGRRPFEAEPTAQALLGILDDFHLRELIDATPAAAGPRTSVRGGVRTRGAAASPRAQAPPTLVEQYREVARALS